MKHKDVEFKTIDKVKDNDNSDEIHEERVKMLCKKIHQLKNILEQKTEELTGINKELSVIVESNKKLEKSIKLSKSKAKP